MKSQRHLFDIPDDIAYFNCAYYSPQLNESRKRLLDGVKAKSHPWGRRDDQKISRGDFWWKTRWLCHRTIGELWFKHGSQGSGATFG
jgi:hypothetical protein